MKEEDKRCTRVYAVIDTNVVVSALLAKEPSSPPVQIIQHILDGSLNFIYNDKIIQEYKDVLTRKKFNFSKEAISQFLNSIQKLGVRIDKTESVAETFPDPDDIVFYEVKMSVDGSYLVTGNKKHFPNKPFIVSPAQMITILKELGIL